MSLVKHAEFELKRAGLFDEDSDYGGMLGKSVLKLVEVFAAEGHSGFSAGMAVEIFSLVARFKTLTPLTNSPEEWCNVSEFGGPNDAPIWQNRRDGSYFSNDGGKTGYSVDDPKCKITFSAEEK